MSTMILHTKTDHKKILLWAGSKLINLSAVLNKILYVDGWKSE